MKPAPRIAGAIVLAGASLLGAAVSAGRGPVPPIASDQPAAFLIDLNAAPPEELLLLPRIGPALAERIVADRVEHGPFDALDDLARVRGIGPLTIERLRGLADALPPAQ